jgi:hypothetical protein
VSRAVSVTRRLCAEHRHRNDRAGNSVELGHLVKGGSLVFEGDEVEAMILTVLR